MSISSFTRLCGDTVHERWKRLHDFTANLLWKLRTKFYQNRLSFTKSLQKKHFRIFFSGLSVERVYNSAGAKLPF